jgi:AcrR family transcriptional regulator
MATTGTSRPGGRTARTQAAVFDATLAELVEHGYDQLSVEAVAARAGVHKTTVYRRWRTKAELVGEALRGTADSRLPIQETDDIIDALRDIGRALLATMHSPAGIAAVRALCSGGEATREIVGFVQGFFADRIRQVAPVVDRAVAHGQLPAGTSPDLLFRHAAAPIYYRTLIMGEHLTDADAELAADAALAAARAGVFSRKT